MHLITRSICLVLLLSLAACEATPPTASAPAADALVNQVPDLFKDNHDSYVILVKQDEREIGAEHRLTFDGIGPIVIATQEVIVWKVAPGVHIVSHAARQADKAMRLEVSEGERVIFEVDGNGGLYIRSFANDRVNLARSTHLAGYHDMSKDAPPEPLQRRLR